MTEKELAVRAYLNRAFYADKKVKALELRIEDCERLIESISSGGGSAEGVLDRLQDLRENLNERINDLLDVSGEIDSVISMLHDEDLEAVLSSRYLSFLTVEETAEKMNYSVPTVKRKISKAVKKLIPFDLVKPV